MISHISIFPEFQDKYKKFLPDDLSDVSIFANEQGVVFFLVILKLDESDNAEYRAEVINSGLTKKCESTEALKNWFLTADLETHVYATNIFPGYYTPDLIKSGYEFLACYSFAKAYVDPEFTHSIIDGYYSTSLQEQHDAIFGSLSEAEFSEMCLIRDWSSYTTGHPLDKPLHLDYVKRGLQSEFLLKIECEDALIFLCKDKDTFERQMEILDEELYS